MGADSVRVVHFVIRPLPGGGLLQREHRAGEAVVFMRLDALALSRDLLDGVRRRVAGE